MPNKKNSSVFKGRRKLQLCELYNNPEADQLYDEEMLMPEENITYLAEIFTSVDKVVLVAVLEECEGNVDKAIEKLLEIIGEGERKTLIEQNDLATIACSLLSDESNPVSRLDIYGDSVLSNETGNPAMNNLGEVGLSGAMESRTNIMEMFSSSSCASVSSAVLSSKAQINENLTALSDFGGAETLNNAPHEGSSMTTQSAANNMKPSNLDAVAHKLTSDSGEAGGHLRDVHCDSQVQTDAKIKNKKQESAKDLNTQQPGRPSTEAKDEIATDQRSKSSPFPHSVANATSPRTTAEWETFYKNMGIGEDDFGMCANNFKPLDVDELVKYSLSTTSSTCPAGQSMSQAAKQCKTSHTNQDQDFAVVEKDTGSPDAEICPSTEVKMPGKRRRRKKKVGGDNTDLGNSVLDSIEQNKAQPSNIMSTGVASKSSSGSSGQSSVINPSVGSCRSAAGNDEVKGLEHKVADLSLKSKLSPKALEFIPRPLAKLQAKPLVLRKNGESVVDSKNTGNKQTIPNMPKPLRPLAGVTAGKKKGIKPNQSKESAEQGTHRASFQNDLNQHPQPWASQNQFSSGKEDVTHHTQSGKQIDPLDPLGWSDVFSELSSTLTDPKPQRAQRIKKSTTFPDKLQEAVSSHFSAQPDMQGTPAANVSASAVSLPAQQTLTQVTSVLPNTNGASFHNHEAGQRHNSPGEPFWASESKPFKSTAQMQMSDKGPISSKPPPSLVHRPGATTGMPTVTYNSAQGSMHKIPSPASVPGNMHKNMSNLRSQSSPALASEQEYIRNKLPFHGVKTPLGVVRRYILEKQPVMIILRGLPGSGKSCLARQLISEGQHMGVEGISLSTDDYFMKNGRYNFNRNELGNAHDWNKQRALEQIRTSRSPIIIDNTNTTMWELLPYAELALEYKYDVQLFEPDTPWRMKVMELARKNTHGVTKEVLKRMKDRYENLTTDAVLKEASKKIIRKSSVAPPVQNHPASSSSQTQSSSKKQPRVVDQLTPSTQHAKAEVTLPKKQDQNSNTLAPPYQDLGLSDWFDSAPQKRPKHKKKVGNPAKDQFRVPTEITMDFFNQSLKKATGSILKMQVEKEGESEIGNISTGFGSLNLGIKGDSGVENVIGYSVDSTRKLSDDRASLKSEMDFADGSEEKANPQGAFPKDEIFAARLDTESITDMKKKDIQTKPSEVVDGNSLLESSLSTTDSYQSCFSDSDVAKNPRAASDGETDDGKLDDTLRGILSEAYCTTQDHFPSWPNMKKSEPEFQDKDNSEPETPGTVVESYPFQTSEMSADLIAYRLSSSEDSSDDNCEEEDRTNKAANYFFLEDTVQESSAGNPTVNEGTGEEDYAKQLQSESSLAMLDHFFEPNNHKSAVTDEINIPDKVDSAVFGRDDHMTDGGELEVKSISTRAKSPSALVDYSDSDSSGKEGSERSDDKAAVGDTQTIDCAETKSTVSSHCESQHFLLNGKSSEEAGLDEGVKNQSEAEGNAVENSSIMQHEERGVSEDRTTMSNESSLVSSREQSPLIDSSADQESSPQRNKKKRIRKGRNPEQFIENSLKLKTRTEKWSTFSIQPTEIKTRIAYDSVSSSGDSPATEKATSSTQCDPYYFSIVHRLNSPAFNNLQPVDLFLCDEKIITSLLSSDLDSGKVLSEDGTGATPVLRRQTTDQSTSTDETLEKEEVDLETLQSCFPEYSRKQLETTMAICQNDLEWVTNHLLDSPALFDMESEEDENRKSPDFVAKPDPTSKSPVKSLRDLCSSLVRQTSEVDSDDLEMQDIQAGQNRLDKIEAFTRSRLHSLSQDNMEDQDRWPDDFELEGFSGTQVPSKPASPEKRMRPSNIGQAFSPHSKAMHYGKTSSSPSHDFLSSLMREKPFTLSPPSGGVSASERMDLFSPGSLSRPLEEEAAAATAGLMKKRGLQVAQSQPILPAEFVRFLEHQYGSLDLQMDKEGLVLDDCIARKIHNCLKLQATKKVLLGPSDQQMKEDEALARALQEEENQQVSGHQNSQRPMQTNVAGWTSETPSWMNQGSAGVSSADVDSLSRFTSGENNPVGPQHSSHVNSVSDTLHHLRGSGGSPVKAYKFHLRMPESNVPQRRSPASGVKSVWGKRKGNTDSLHSIMEEERAQEEKQREQMRKMESTSDTQALATKIKRMKLAQLFPHLSPDFLEEVFANTGYSLDKSVKTLETTYNITSVPIYTVGEEHSAQSANEANSQETGIPIYEDPEAIYWEEKELSYESLRSEARLYRTMAKDCQAQAQRCQTNGLQAAALFYRQKIKLYKEEEYNANQRAAEVLFERGSERLAKENTLDLHFYHLDEAIHAVNFAVAMKEEEYKRKPDKKNTYINIITGRGKNSKGGVPRLKPAVMNHLRDRRLRFEDRSPGMLRVYLNQRFRTKNTAT